MANRWGRLVRARVLMLAAVACIVSLAVVALPASAALADNPAPPADSTTTTAAPPDTTTTTAAPPDTTTTTAAPPDTTTTTAAPPDTVATTAPPAPPDDSTTTTAPPDAPAPASTSLTPDETLAPQPGYTYLSDSQRAVLLDLQNANDTLATRQFAFFGLSHQLDAAKDHLKAARLAENAAATSEMVGLLGAALPRDDGTAPVASALATSSTNQLARAVVQGKSADTVLDTRVAEVDALAHRLESERKTATRERVQAQASVATLSAFVAVQKKQVTDAAATRATAEAAEKNEFGSDGGLLPQPDSITAALASAQAGQTAPILIAGFVFPIPGAPLGSPFGIRIDPLGGGVGFHPGLDFEADTGTPIHAAMAGVVIMAGDCGGYGNCVVIDHGSLLATVYGHQSQVLVQVGDHVAAGQEIGLVGSTGMSTGPHLHFEVRLKGIPIDPIPTLTG